MSAILDDIWPATPRSVAPARRAVVKAAEQAGAGEATLHDIALAVSEACTNVVVHAYTGDDEPGHFRVQLVEHDHEMCVLVTDWGSGMRPRPDSPGLGLGLPLIARLSSSMEVTTGDAEAGTTLCMAFRSGAGRSRGRELTGNGV